MVKLEGYDLSNFLNRNDVKKYIDKDYINCKFCNKLIAINDISCIYFSYKINYVCNSADCNKWYNRYTVLYDNISIYNYDSIAIKNLFNSANYYYKNQDDE